jgi:hypothetical protein
METSKQECIRRCVKRGGEYEHWKAAVDKWFKENPE